MRRLMLFALGSGVAVAAFAAGAVARQATEPAKKTDESKGASGDAMAVLKKAEDALKKVKLARYKAQYKGTAWVTAYVPSIEGSAIVGELSKYDIVRFRTDVKITPTGSSEVTELSAGSDGDLFYLIDPKAKTVYVDIDEAVLGTHSRNVQRVLLRSFVDKEPLADDLKAKTVELKEAVEVGGESCHQVHVTRSETQEVVWFISKNDSLPRRVDRLYKNPQGEVGSTELVLTDLVVKSTPDMALFKLNVPPGFTKTDEFAP